MQPLNPLVPHHQHAWPFCSLLIELSSSLACPYNRMPNDMQLYIVVFMGTEAGWGKLVTEIRAALPRENTL